MHKKRKEISQTENSRLYVFQLSARKRFGSHTDLLFFRRLPDNFLKNIIGKEMLLRKN